MDGIRIPEEAAAASGVPEDLDSSVLGPYRFPSPARRAAAGVIYLTAAGLSALAALADLSTGFWALALGLVALAGYHFQTAWPLAVEQEQALAAAAARAPFTVGHASAALTFVGWRSRPVWNVILYSAEDPPERRALIRLYATDGRPLDDPYIEDLTPPSSPA